MRIFVTSIFLTLLFSGCNKKSELQEENHVSYENKMTLNLIGESRIPLTDKMGFIHGSLQYLDHQDYQYLSFLNFMNNEVVVYDFEKETIEKQVVLKQEGPDGVGALPPPSAHLMISLDSFLIYNMHSHNLFLVDDKSQVLKKYELVNPRKDSYSPVPYPSSLNPIIRVGADVFFPCSVNTMQEEYDDYKTVLRLNLRTGETEYLFSLPEKYNEKFWGIYFKYLVSITYNQREQKLIMNYPIDHNLYLGNTSGEVEDTKYIGSNYIGDISGWSDDLSVGLKTPTREEFKNITDFSFSTSDYVSIKYDPHRQVYYRIVHVRPELEIVKTGLRTAAVSIIILSEEFEKIGEVLFDADLYNHSMIFVSKEGLNLARKDMYVKDENSITFETFALEELR